MNPPYPIVPYIQQTMAQAMHAMLTGSPLPPNVFVVVLPMQQAQQIFPQLMLGYTPGGGGGGGPMMYPQQALHYGQSYQPQIGPYRENQQSNALVPYSNYYAQGYNQNYNYPAVAYAGYDDKSKKIDPYGKTNHSAPHSNVYNSSSFDSYMRNLSWNRLFGDHHPKQPNRDQAALSYDQKTDSTKQQGTHSGSSSTLSSLTTSTSSSTTSDETIRRVDVSNNQPSGSKQQTKSSLPFKYSSEFIPGSEKASSQKSSKKGSKVKIDDVFVVKKTEQSKPLSEQ